VGAESEKQGSGVEQEIGGRPKGKAIFELKIGKLERKKPNPEGRE